MIPPPAMTTSAVSMPVEAPELEDQLQRGQDRDVAGVEGRRDLDDVEADELRVLGRDLEQVERLARRQPAGGRDLRSWSVRGVERIDVEGNVDLLAVKRLRDAAHGAVIGGQLPR